MIANTLVIDGKLVDIGELKYTPAGIPVKEFLLLHTSEQVEAKMRRRVECEVRAVAFGDVVNQLSNIGLDTCIRAHGFLAKKSLKSTQLILHIQTLEIL